jgi:alanyl aminopeptidase
MEIPLAAKKCPDWVLPNDGGVGYYRVLYENDALDRLLDDGGRKLALPERLSVLSDAHALAHAGKIPYGEVLALLPALARDPSREVTREAVDLVAGLRDQLVPSALRANYARLIQKLWGARARQLGLKPQPKEDDDTRLLRPTLVGLVADEGDDKRLGAEATQLVQKWLTDKSAIDADMLSAVFGIAAARGDKALWETLRAAAKTAESRRERERLLGAMSAFRDPAIVKEQLPLLFTDEVFPAEAMRLVWGALSFSGTRDVAYEFLKSHFDELAGRLPRESLAALPWTATPFCDPEHQKDLDGFFRGRSTKFPGGPRALEQANEAMTLCQSFKKAQAQSVAAFLKKN